MIRSRAAAVEGSPTAPLRILLVRLRLIGDVVFTTPLIRALRIAYPAAHLAYVVEPPAAPVVRQNPHLSEVLVIPRSHGVARLRDDLLWARRLRAGRFDVALDLHGGPRSAWLTFATGASRRVGYAMAGRTWMYTDLVHRAPDLSSRHSVENQWDLLEPLGIAPPTRVANGVEMEADPAAAARVDQRLHSGGVHGHPLFVVHVSAGNPFRRWPASHFVDLTCALARIDPRRRIVLTSGPSDPGAARAVAESARAALGDLSAAVPDLGEFDLAELRALVARAAVYIGGDSGPMHVAATTSTPIVALLGPTLAGRSLPWRDPALFAEGLAVEGLACRPCHQRHCVPGDFRCLTGLPADRVLDAVERAVRRSPIVASSPMREVIHR